MWDNVKLVTKWALWPIQWNLWFIFKPNISWGARTFNGPDWDTRNRIGGIGISSPKILFEQMELIVAKNNRFYFQENSSKRGAKKIYSFYGHLFKYLNVWKNQLFVNTQSFSCFIKTINCLGLTSSFLSLLRERHGPGELQPSMFADDWDQTWGGSNQLLNSSSRLVAAKDHTHGFCRFPASSHGYVTFSCHHHCLPTRSTLPTVY